MVVCDECGTSVRPEYNYCHECGSEISPKMIDWTDGFLPITAQGHIQQAIDGNRTPPEKFHERMHETVRHAFTDFCVLDRWDEFDNREALVGDISTWDPDENDSEEIEKLARLTCPFRFLINGVGVEGVADVFALSVSMYKEDPNITLDDVTVTIEIEQDEEE
jgi:hypothetical protein